MADLRVTYTYNASCVTSQKCITDFVLFNNVTANYKKAFYLESEDYKGITMDRRSLWIRPISQSNFFLNDPRDCETAVLNFYLKVILQLCPIIISLHLQNSALHTPNFGLKFMYTMQKMNTWFPQSLKCTKKWSIRKATKVRIGENITR